MIRETIMYEIPLLSLIDQVDAANEDQAHMADLLVRELCAVQSEPLPFALELMHRLAARLIHDDLTMCEHLGLRTPRPCFWSPSLPGRLRCWPCHLYAGRRLAGTAKDHSCDSCGAYAYRDLHMATLSLPGRAVDLSSFGCPPVALPPTTIVYGQCSRCHAADRVPGETG
jgi:hypothetical protein